jgi:DNA-binding response OmpR family regulator
MPAGPQQIGHGGGGAPGRNLYTRRRLDTLEEEASPTISHAEELMAEGKTILVVDDDMELSDGLRTVLQRQGYHVLQARDGQQGKQMIYQQRPDLVILDMMMPRMGGYPVLEHFRDKRDAPPIIMITANEGSRHKAYAEYLGVVDYLRKPFAMERLLEAVERGFARAAEAAKKAGDTPKDEPE